MNSVILRLTILPLLMTASLAVGKVIGTDDRRPIASTYSPYDHIFKLVNGILDCTAFRIKRGFALTARHCLVGDNAFRRKTVTLIAAFSDDIIRIREGLPALHWHQEAMAATLVADNAAEDWALLQFQDEGERATVFPRRVVSRASGMTKGGTRAWIQGIW